MARYNSPEGLISASEAWLLSSIPRTIWSAVSCGESEEGGLSKLPDFGPQVSGGCPPSSQRRLGYQEVLTMSDQRLGMWPRAAASRAERIPRAEQYQAYP